MRHTTFLVELLKRINNLAQRSLDNSEFFALIVYVKGPIFEQLMQVYLSKEFLLEQKVGLLQLISEIQHFA